MGGSEKGRQQRRGTIEGREGGGQDGREGQARRQRQRVEKMVDTGTRGKGAGEWPRVGAARGIMGAMPGAKSNLRCKLRNFL